jgi:hypothetical protein
MGVSGVHSVGLRGGIHQCEFCARWTHDGAFIAGIRDGRREEHFVCRHCRREAENNSFVRQALDRWHASNTPKRP